MDLQDKLYYGIKDIFECWTAMKLAREGEWGGPDTMEKIEWLNETLADYLYDGNQESFLFTCWFRRGPDLGLFYFTCACRGREARCAGH